MIEPELWPILDRVMQWLIIPAIAALWALHAKLNASDSINAARHSDAEKNILRLMTILEERDKQRQNDNRHAEKAFSDLQEVIEKLSERLDRFMEHEK